MWLLLALVLALAGCGDVVTRLPPLPPLAGRNEATLAAFREADSFARDNPSSAEAAGKLGMLYHAHLLLDQASACYEVARALDPDEFRWVYYGAKADKSAFRYEPSESLFLRALELSTDGAEVQAELGELYLMWGRRDDAASHLDKALHLDPLQPVAALGKARLLTLAQDWKGVIELLTPLLERHPRLSKAHQFLAAAYGALGMERARAHHQEAGEYGSAVESRWMAELYQLAVPAILEGDPALGPEVLKNKCARCHDHHRIYDHDEDREWWASTVRRMQREAGFSWLTDDEAASVAAYLSER